MAQNILLRGGGLYPLESKYSQIAECAYYKAEARLFESGHEMEDWLESEYELSQ